MICRYGYMVENIKRGKSGYQWVGYYECEVEDLKRLWKKIGSEVVIMYVKFKNGEQWNYLRNKGWYK